MKTMSGLTVALLLSAHCCTLLANEADDAHRDFIRQQESFSQQLRNQDNAPLRHMLEQQIRQNSLSENNSRFIADLEQNQRDANQEKPARGALYFVSFSIPPTGLKRMLAEASHYSIPATLRGMVSNDMKTTAEAVMELVKDGSTSGVAIDPMRYRQFGITSVPALVVYCETGHDVIRGNLQLKQALGKVVEKGECKEEAQRLLDKGEDE
ncbi:type-F conjugative transfer system pilin assembly protein TrbC [Ewingella americana]|uniref:type-F conjugative transfer system pilin assembly protein TrbC n=1 Tax=Ewingella americana TaxID=41202 RepID=UPI0012ADB06E|nr:type-F conjugative transfer system pilin assembly protein TrbC [Ewingella americana]MRT06046.1 type-F conjugative transfer system pilin assembly protein TrbC [Ewingella americana]